MIKKKDVSRTLCETSKEYIKKLTQANDKKTNKTNKTIKTKKSKQSKTSKTSKTSNKTTYTKYNNYIKKIVKSFVNSQGTLLDTIFKIKKECQFDITYKEEMLYNNNNNNNNYTIPAFIDIFRYLITINEFISQFTLDEQKILIENLNNNKAKEDCYTFLDTSPIGKKILSIYNNLMYNNSYIYSNLLIKFPSLNFHSLLINSFTSYKILEDLETNIKKVIVFSIQWKGIKLDNIIYLFIYDNETFDTHKEILNLGREIIKRLLFFNEFLNTNKYPDRFILFLTDKKKEIDKELIEQLHFKTINVNTAVTNTKDIIIYRKEELFKSIFHECIHFHNLDFRKVSQPLLNSIINYLIKTHNIDSNNEYLLYECVTETLANILNTIYYSGDIKNMSINLENEILFSTLQVSKILKVCNYKKWNDFSITQINKNKKHNNNLNFNKSINKHILKKQFKQDSCVYSYYILKLYILLNISTYFATIIDNKLKFIQTEATFNKLIKLFDVSRTNVLLKDIINSILKGLYITDKTNKTMNKTQTHKSNLNNKSNKKSNKKINKKTLRMTCLESNIFAM
jgi:hypothetical protein